MKDVIVSSIAAHKLVAEVAADLGHRAYAELAKDNAWYKRNPDETAWCKEYAGGFVKAARGALAEKLSSNISDRDKEHIYQALMVDTLLPMSEERGDHVLENYIANELKEWKKD